MVFLITNENLGTYDEIYHFKGKDVLSVVGSGDQYFVSKLCGAKKVDLFDNYKEAWYYFVLKFMALRNLSYEDFFRYIISGQLSDTETYERLRNFLPDDVRDYFEYHYRFFYTCELVPLSKHLYIRGPKYGDGSIIPYFNEANYYKLRNILNHEELPNYYYENITDLSGKLSGSYDIMLASNIYTWLVERKIINNPEQYMEILDKFPVEVIQANYLWDRYGHVNLSGFGCKETILPSVDEYDSNNYVYTYTKRNDIWIPEKIES